MRVLIFLAIILNAHAKRDRQRQVSSKFVKDSSLKRQGRLHQVASGDNFLPKASTEESTYSLVYRKLEDGQPKVYDEGDCINWIGNEEKLPGCQAAALKNYSTVGSFIPEVTTTNEIASHVVFFKQETNNPLRPFGLKAAGDIDSLVASGGMENFKSHSKMWFVSEVYPPTTQVAPSKAIPSPLPQLSDKQLESDNHNNNWSLKDIDEEKDEDMENLVNNPTVKASELLDLSNVTKKKEKLAQGTIRISVRLENGLTQNSTETASTTDPTLFEVLHKNLMPEYMAAGCPCRYSYQHYLQNQHGIGLHPCCQCPGSISYQTTCSCSRLAHPEIISVIQHPSTNHHCPARIKDLSRDKSLTRKVFNRKNSGIYSLNHQSPLPEINVDWLEPDDSWDENSKLYLWGKKPVQGFSTSTLANTSPALTRRATATEKHIVTTLGSRNVSLESKTMLTKATRTFSPKMSKKSSTTVMENVLDDRVLRSFGKAIINIQSALNQAKGEFRKFSLARRSYRKNMYKSRFSRDVSSTPSFPSERIQPLLVESDGWGSWSSWSPCSVTCGKGTQKRTRSKLGGYAGIDDKETEERECRLPNCKVPLMKLIHQVLKGTIRPI